MTWGSDYWPWFLLAAFVAFAVPEGYALATNYRNTLSWWIWNLLRERPGESIVNWTAPHYLVGGALIVIFTWLIGHLLFHLWG